MGSSPVENVPGMAKTSSCGAFSNEFWTIGVSLGCFYAQEGLGRKRGQGGE
jgi:hypothetical protein